MNQPDFHINALDAIHHKDFGCAWEPFKPTPVYRLYVKAINHLQIYGGFQLNATPNIGL